MKTAASEIPNSAPMSRAERLLVRCSQQARHVVSSTRCASSSAPGRRAGGCIPPQKIGGIERCGHERPRIDGVGRRLVMTSRARLSSTVFSQPRKPPLARVVLERRQRPQQAQQHVLHKVRGLGFVKPRPSRPAINDGGVEVDETLPRDGVLRRTQPSQKSRGGGFESHDGTLRRRRAPAPRWNRTCYRAQGGYSPPSFTNASRIRRRR